jgi:sugar phosphate isomerase/epimerase
MSHSTGRRAFIKAGAALGSVTLGGAAIGSLAQEASAQSTYLAHRRLKLSLAAYSFRSLLTNGQMTMEDFIDYCDELNLEGTELTSYYFDAPNPRDPRTVDDDYLRRLRLKCFKQGLDISGTAIGNNFVKADAAERRAEIENVKLWIDKANTLGAPVIRIFGGSRFPEGATEDDVYEWVIPALQESVAYAAEKGIVLALENHGGFPETAEQTIRLVKTVDNPWLGVTLDTGNFDDNWFAQMAALVPYASTVQVKPYLHSNYAGTSTKIATDPERIIRLLKLNGYKGYVVMEYGDSDDPYKAVPPWMARLRELCS